MLFRYESLRNIQLTLRGCIATLYYHVSYLHAYRVVKEVLFGETALRVMARGGFALYACVYEAVRGL